MEKHTCKLSEIILIDRKFKKIFGVRFLEFIDKELARIGYGAHLDVVGFDRYLKGNYKDYTDEMSMNEFVKIKFGGDALKFIEELI